MSYNSSNNDSVIQLGEGSFPSDQELATSIPLPSSVPPDELVLTENDDAIQIPDQIPAGEQVLIDPIELTAPVVFPTVIRGDKYYVHTQTVASDVWVITHNLQKHPAIHIEDSTGQEIIAEIVHVTNNIARVYFGGLYVGTAHCN